MSCISYAIRPATAQDAAAIRRLIWRVGINPMALDWQRFRVAVDEQGRLLGCGQIKPHGDGTRELASIAVEPEFQRMGIGKALILDLLEDQPLPLYLTCRASLGGYYRPFGFAEVPPPDLPPYFRRIRYLVDFFRRLIPGMQENLLVMVKKA